MWKLPEMGRRPSPALKPNCPHLFVCVLTPIKPPNAPPLPPLARLLLIGSAGSDQLHTRREDLEIKVWFTGKLITGKLTATLMHHQKKKQQPKYEQCDPFNGIYKCIYI